MMNELFGEFLGTLILILLGNGVVAGVVLPKTKSNSSGWIVITMGWGIAVAVAVFVSGKLSPAHLNPAVTIGVALKGGLPWASVFPYILAQFAGAMLGQILVWLQFKPHYEAEEKCRQYPGNLQYWTSHQRHCIKLDQRNPWNLCFGVNNLCFGSLRFSGRYRNICGGDFDCRYRSITRWDNRLCLEPCA